MEICVPMERAGTTKSAHPVSIPCSGIDGNMESAGSCTMVLAPESFMERNPFEPSRPDPDSKTPIIFRRFCLAKDSNNTSTEGRCICTGPLEVRCNRPPPKTRWKSGGAIYATPARRSSPSSACFICQCALRPSICARNDLDRGSRWTTISRLTFGITGR